MTRLDWGKPGERFYETGVDRGVLYIDDVGHAWSGLVSVAESLTGGEAKPHYIDGFKYANVAAAEEFEATINAFSAPREFGPCDGSVSVYNGLIATQQPRRPFGFSYRTKIGNDTEGVDHAYKIHLVYNALAAPASRTHTTLGQENSPQTLSWRLTTLPPKITGFKPTAHFVVDSRNTPPNLMAYIEDILYGTETANPRLPTAVELLGIFQSEGPVIRRNYVLNPSFRAAPMLVDLRRNFVRNPCVRTGTTDWLSGGALTRIQDSGKWWLKTQANTHTYAGFNAGVVGKFYAWSLRVKGTPGIRVAFASTDNVVGAWADVASETIPASGEIVVRAVATRAVAGPSLFFGIAASTTDSIQITEAFCEEVSGVGAFAGGYFDGETADADGVEYSWTGTADLSVSLARGYGISNWTNGVSGRPFYKTGTPDGFGGFFAEIRQTGLAYMSASAVGVVGEYWGARLIIGKAPDTPTGARVRPRIHDGTGFVTADVAGAAADGYVVIPDIPTEFLIRSSQPLTNPAPRLYIYSATSYPVRVALVIMDRVSGPGLAPDGFFDGNTPDADGYFYSWEGVADNSKSLLKSWN